MEKPNPVRGIVERLGNVLYWAGCVGAPVAFLYVYGDAMEYKDSPLHKPEITTFALLCAVSVWLTGLVARYVLNGRSLWKKRPKP